MQSKLLPYMYALDDIAQNYRTITSAVELLYQNSQEAVDDDVVLCKMFRAHFKHLLPCKDSTVERCGRFLRSKELKRPIHLRRFQRSDDIRAENLAQEHAHRRYWANN